MSANPSHPSPGVKPGALAVPDINSLPVDPAEYSQVPIESLEVVRTRLRQLTNSLNKLRDTISYPVLPPWSSIQSQFNIICTQLISLSTALSQHSETFQAAVVYPMPSFPTSAEETLLSTLLRKKYLPEIDEWIDEALELSKGITLRFDEELNKEANEIIEEEIRKRNFLGFYTKQELDEGKCSDGSDLRPDWFPEDWMNGDNSSTGSGNLITIDEINQFTYQNKRPTAAKP